MCAAARREAEGRAAAADERAEAAERERDVRAAEQRKAEARASETMRRRGAAELEAEAIELAKACSGDDSAPFVNGVLDGVRRLLESAEPPRPPGTEEPLPR